MARIVVADDFEVVRTGLKVIIARQRGWSVCGEAANGLEAVSKVLELQPDLIILDIDMPILSGAQAAAEIRKLAPATKILILSMHDDSVLSKMRLEADACLSKGNSEDKLIQTISALVSGSKNRPLARPAATT